jgi:phosphoribosyl 1,2-cyclic phosphate phosphodiesterase
MAVENGRHGGGRSPRFTGVATAGRLCSISRVAEFSLTFLGTGTSVGVPVIGCDCAVCTSFEERNKRTRSSVVVRYGDLAVLVDSGPDLRQQALREGLREIDAVIYTHGHLDHVAGFDELRAFCWRRTAPLPLHATPSCMELLMRMYGWAFFPDQKHNGYVRPDPRLIAGEFTYGDLRVTPLPVEHASVETVGFLFEVEGARSVAYLPDVKVIPETTMRLLAGVDVLVVDALRPSPHPTHFSLAEALAVVTETGAKETWLTHLGHDYDARTFGDDLPFGVHLAWDGLRISLGDTPGLA